jgi:hypothetical protein
MAILDYIRLRQDHPGAFFRMEDGTPTTKGWFIGKLRGILSSIDLPQGDYAGHSFRIGATTTAAMAGVEDSMIQALGRWQSAAFLQYNYLYATGSTGSHFTATHHHSILSRRRT